MWLDAIAAALVAILAFLGFRRGALATALQIGTLLGAYAVALLAGPRIGASVAEAIQMPLILGVAGAGLGLFLFSYLVFCTIAYFIRKRDEDRRYGRSLADRIGGAAIGTAQGALIALLLGLLGSWLDAGRTVGKIEALPPTADARVSHLSRGVIETAAGTFIGPEDTRSRVILQLTTRPGETLQAATALVERAEIRALQSDELFWTYLEHGQIDSALNSSSFLALSYKREIREQMSRCGMADPRGVDDPSLFREEMSAMLQALAPRVRALRRDPEIAGLANDPTIAHAIEEGNTAALLAHPTVRRIVQRILAGPEPEDAI